MHWSYVFLALNHRCDVYPVLCFSGSVWPVMPCMGASSSYSGSLDSRYVGHSGETGGKAADGSLYSLSHFPWEIWKKFRWVTFKLILVINGWGISCEIVPRWISLDRTDDESTLVLVMAWCRQATSHYLSQCWSRSMLPYGVTRPHWVSDIISKLIGPWEMQM